MLQTIDDPTFADNNSLCRCAAGMDSFGIARMQMSFSITKIRQYEVRRSLMGTDNWANRSSTFSICSLKYLMENASPPNNSVIRGWDVCSSTVTNTSTPRVFGRTLAPNDLKLTS